MECSIECAIAFCFSYLELPRYDRKDGTVRLREVRSDPGNLNSHENLMELLLNS